MLRHPLLALANAICTPHLGYVEKDGYELYFGSYQKLFDAPKNYQKVTPADIQRVAQSYLKKSNRTVAVLDSAEDKDL